MRKKNLNILLVILGLGATSALALAPERNPGSAEAVPDGLSASDWSGIRAAYEANRHRVEPVEGGYRAHNPGQRWQIDFDGRGFIARPEGANWEWGLELKSYGVAGNKRAARTGAAIRGEANRVSYERGPGLSEWMINDQRGLEHGFTLAEAPDPAGETGGELEFDLAVRGELRPEVAQGGHALRFLDARNETVVTYEKLRVWDAGGRELPARFVPRSDGVRLTVETAGATYPITIDPLAQQAYLKASNSEADDLFGYAVAISGETVVIGAFGEDSNATGINGNQSDNSAGNSGAAYIFVRDGATWSQQAYLKASNSEASDTFGYAVAISGETVVVAAVGEDSNATGINGNQSDNSGDGSGAVYVFVRDGTTWSQQAYLKASNTEISDFFGSAVAISGETVIVWARYEDGNATGINGNQSDNSAENSGAAYVFVRNGTTWSQQSYLKASNTEALDLFGFSVAISDETVFVAALLEDSNATGINGNQSDNSALDSGAAYVFVREGTTWSQQSYLKASNTEISDFFGYAVATSGETLVIGAYLEDSNATGINGNQSDNSAENSGAAYVFVRNGTTWSQQSYLKASNTEADDLFGYAVAISGETVVVGAVLEDNNATGVNGNQSDNSALDSGAAYVFVREGTTWSQQSYLKASNTEADDNFGYAVATSGDTVVVGARFEESNATGINGNQSDNSAFRSGAVYVFNGLRTTLGNISTRLRIETGDNVLIGGFIITGSEPKEVLVRAIGPSLPLAGSLADPFLELYNAAGTLIASNDNWMASPNRQDIIDTTIPPANDLESAILATLDPGPYTAIMRGVDETTGIGLIEAYDLDQTVDSELANISTRGFVQTGDNVMIGGFILGGPSAQDVLVRAIGPSLPLAAKLADPVVELYNAHGSLLASNDNWRSDQEAEIMATGIPPADDLEAAILATLSPAAYTAIVRGKGGVTGVALVEVYNLGASAELSD